MTAIAEAALMDGELGRRDKAAGIWARDAHDFYCEPAWTSKRLFEEEEFVGSITDPACGLGTIIKSARLCGLFGVGYDVIDRSSECVSCLDFLSSDWTGEDANFVSNPPFGVADQFDAPKGLARMILAEQVREALGHNEGD